ncbi:AMP-binding protein [Candidatus Halobonum tyrrellensis]|uniref:AMP-dependent synthetase/ligase domain-containing protein n=1 Tax=Candidatus Halobonum tyrrellensis G22 TaxID=1324957 RepID=V4HDC3_9EURY|nr:AMP-binding protein [Candidatus Halobonum tyrrellensis]ESP88715.1 hypothetical protein K933_07688 [Candidatus Halobonum tyrrellensis G22]
MTDSDPRPGADPSASDAAVVPDLVARERRSDRPAVVDAARGRTHSYADVCTTAYKAGNVLRHLGVHDGARVAVEAAPAFQPLTTFLGSALLGAVTAFDAAPGTDARVVVVDARRESEFDLPPGSKLCAFGGAPDRADTTHWEGEVWSENPAFPPATYDPDAPVLAADGATHDHATLLDAARGAVDALDLTADDRVDLRAPLSDPRAVAAGVLAPLLAGGAVRLPVVGAEGGESGEADAAEAATAAVATGDSDPPDAPDVPTLWLADVSLSRSG